MNKNFPLQLWGEHSHVPCIGSVKETCAWYRVAAVAGFCPFHWRRDDDGRSTMHAKPFDPSALF
jgi:hypothetical protein